MKARAYIRTFFAILTAVSLVAACAKEKRVQANQEIVVSPFGTSLTKAGTELLETDKVFGIYAYNAACAGGVAWNTSAAWGSATEYLSNVAFAYKDEGYWGGHETPYYWPFSGSLMFAGYCPHKDFSDETVTDVALVPNKEGNNPYLQIVFIQKTDPSQMVDLMWFDVADVNSGKTATKTDGPINLSFKHALSKVWKNVGSKYAWI